MIHPLRTWKITMPIKKKTTLERKEGGLCKRDNVTKLASRPSCHLQINKICR